MYQTNVGVNVLVVLLTVVLLLRGLLSPSGLLLPWLPHDCAYDCLSTYFLGPPKYADPALLAAVRETYLTPPPPHPDTSPFNVNEPVWSKLVDWNLVQENLKEIWEGQPPGVFVEVGASDGQFMSQTLMLERTLGWSGLLVEPDPRAFTILQKRRRRAWTTPLCIIGQLPSVRRYWLRDLDEDLPEHFQQLLMARSKLNDDTLVGDEESGGTVLVPCMPLSIILLAANITSIDFLTSATGVDGDETRMADVLHSKKFDVKTLLIHYPTGRLFEEPYPQIPGYILDMGHSTLQVKLYVKRSHCQLILNNDCKKINHYDSVDACLKYLCFDFMTVHSPRFDQKEKLVQH